MSTIDFRSKTCGAGIDFRFSVESELVVKANHSIRNVWFLEVPQFGISIVSVKSLRAYSFYTNQIQFFVQIFAHAAIGCYRALHVLGLLGSPFPQMKTNCYYSLSIDVFFVHS